MTQSKEEVAKKWAPILDSIGVTGSRADWMSQYVSKHQANEDFINQPTQQAFPSLLPIAMKISSKLVANDLVSVQPLGGPSGDKLNEIKKEVKSTNRDRKIDSVIDGKEYEEMKVEDHPDYKKGSMPQGKLFYFDYQYGSTSSNSFI